MKALPYILMPSPWPWPRCSCRHRLPRSPHRSAIITRNHRVLPQLSTPLLGKWVCFMACLVPTARMVRFGIQKRLQDNSLLLNLRVDRLPLESNFWASRGMQLSPPCQHQPDSRGLHLDSLTVAAVCGGRARMACSVDFRLHDYERGRTVPVT